MDLERAVAGLSRDKTQKVYAFRSAANTMLSGTSQRAMSLHEAVKYMYSAKFDSKRAEDIFMSFQKNYIVYNLANLSSQKQLLNAEIRSKKIEILGARDNDGAQLLLFTPSRHDAKSCDHKTAMQLLFLLLDQISESYETQLKGITLLIDMQNSSLGSYDTKYTNLILSVLEGGYPLCLHMVYIVECPSWLNGESLHKRLQDKGKIKMTTLSNLSNYISATSLPVTLGGSLNPTKSAAIVGGAATDFSRHKATPPVAPPPRHTKPILKQQSVPSLKVHNATPTNKASDDSLEVQLAGNVNKMRDIFLQQATPSTPPISVKSPPAVSREKKSETRPFIAVPVASKPLPPPKTAREKNGVVPTFKLPLLPSFIKSKQKQNGVTNTDDTSMSKKEFYSAEEVQIEREETDAFRSRSCSEDKAHSMNVKQSKNIGASDHQDSQLKSKHNHETSASSMPSAKKSFKALMNIKKLKPPGNRDIESSRTAEEQLSIVSIESNGTNKSKMSMYHNVSVKPTRPLAKILTDSYSNDQVENTAPPTSMTGQQAHLRSSKVTPISSAPPTSPPPPPPISVVASPTSQSITTKSSDSTSEYSEVNYNRILDVSDRPRRNEYENIFIDYSDEEDEGDDILTCINDHGIYENYGPNNGNKWMSILDLQQYVNDKDKDGLSSEYYSIKNEPLSDSFDSFKLSCNTTKNRYKDVVCYDSTRVKLSTLPGIEGSDYIHANYINGYKKPKAIILTQGPLKRTVNDYWRMLWEKHIFVVVMATKCVEMGKLKCAQYWPDGKQSKMFGDISVSVECNQVYSFYEFRQFTAVRKGVTRTVMHYQFLGWPDYGVPSSGAELLEVLYAAREMQESYHDYVSNPESFPVNGPPMVIHCSAGIGRSGTFCALDYCIDELRMTNKVNVQNCVRLLRQQRAFSIQTDEQYIFCYNTVLEYALYLKSVLKK